MLLEALVATTCIVGQTGCNQASAAYYQSNKQLQEAVKNAEEIGQRLIKGHEYIVYTLTPVYAIAVGKPAVFKLHKNLNLNIDPKGNALALQWNY